MPETSITPPPTPEGTRLGPVMEKLRVLSQKPRELGQTARRKLESMRSNVGREPRGVLEELTKGEGESVPTEEPAAEIAEV
ncbi:MAG: hypothetical protein ACMG6E_09490, partial [Candidatus Roizmanbacteria bacterium]